jgi:RNA polymerase sigma-70 factor (ECF subfamily)
MPEPPDLERFRSYLHLLACLQMQGRGQARFDPSDVVQQTLLEAWQEGERFRGQTDAERAAWLRQVLAHNLADALRAQDRDCRDVRREQSLQAGLDQSSAQLGQFLADHHSSPSRRLAREEQAVLLAEALAQLPEAQREALVLQYWHRWTLAQIGEHLQRTPAAVAGLLKRGLHRLRELLGETT